MPQILQEPMQIRRLDSADAPAYQALRLHALQESPTAFGSSYEEERDTPIGMIETRLAPNPDRHVFGAFVEAQLVGMAGLVRESGLKARHRGFIRAMYVAPSHRGKGIARHLLTEALALAQRMPGLLQVTLSVTAGNESATALYRSFGFETYGVAPGALRVDGVLYDEVQMVRQLAAN
ncbi:GNAT family N-acetyltransferase [Variovorax sp. KBW07]|uniref:GNAT family N-acetyltransferase n=1 Tax=Variovorax sp. KBW07 TaxID=2153358 RepID=UPI0021A9B5FD|nr:GNAT family N-acetyltransferase [Variovorax sp. KBW07]